mmetsp:Transcript_81450/g.216163  ORF Transcript_81450/g.216163 Transcript_81450/m.216163 type:complete len:251 (-) Transcript_81450:1243-1995(-)
MQAEPRGSQPPERAAATSPSPVADPRLHDHELLRSGAAGHRALLRRAHVCWGRLLCRRGLLQQTGRRGQLEGHSKCGHPGERAEEADALPCHQCERDAVVAGPHTGPMDSSARLGLGDIVPVATLGGDTRHEQHHAGWIRDRRLCAKRLLIRLLRAARVRQRHAPPGDDAGAAGALRWPYSSSAYPHGCEQVVRLARPVRPPGAAGRLHHSAAYVVDVASPGRVVHATGKRDIADARSHKGRLRRALHVG